MTEAGYRLSPQQRRLWQVQQRDGSVLRASCVLLLEGDLDRGALDSALRDLVARHEILRTTFQRPPGRAVPLQMVHERVDGLEPVLQARLAERPEGGSLLTLDLPALCADPRSLDNLAAELAAAYADALAGRREEREVFQYARFSEWQHLLADDADAGSGKAFWRQRLPAGFAARSLPFELRPAAPRPFEPLSRREAPAGPATEVALLGAWQALLWRLTGEREQAVGTLYPCREYDVLAGAVGLMAKSLPVSCRFDEGLDGRQLLRRIETELQEVGERADDPGLEEAMAEAGGGEGAYLPFAFESRTLPAPLRSGGLVFTMVEKDCAVDRFHLRMTRFAGPDGVEIGLDFAPSRYDAADVDRIGRWFGTLLAGLTGAPDRPLADLDLLTEAERREVLAAGHGPEPTWPAGLRIHEMFEQTARRRAGEPAVVHGDRRLTYGQLAEESGQLAARLRAAGVGPETLVGLCLERSLEMVVGLLGILRAGGAYVPLDPGLPAGRLHLMTESAGIGHVVTVSPLATLFGEEIGKILLDEAAGEAPAPTASAPGVPENLAYVLFTSGSTGTPKGVAVEHRQLVHYTGAARERLGLPEGARYAVVSAIAADLGNTTLFPSLTAGGCLCLASEEEATDPGRFREFMRRNRVDALKITPTHLAALLGSEPAREALPEAVLVLGGEPADPRWLGELRALAPGLRLLNHYGPTETTVGVTTFEIERPDGPVPLGRPLGGGRVYLLDEGLSPVPPGVPGEVHIGGPGVARGYAGRPAETAERFIPDPFSAAAGERLYRSGDLARLLPGGDLLFLGRRDHQIKLRGFRVEPGEIEAVLRSLPGVEDAAVVLREDTPGDQRLVAYLAAAAGVQPDLQALRGELRSRLPEPMVPAAIVALKALPRTGGGKVDRRALPAPDPAARSREFVAPRTPLEEIVAGLWAEVLKVERVGVEDDFFDLGGHSLLAIQIVSRLKETFRVDVPLRTVLLAGSVARLSQALVENEAYPGQIDKITRAIQKIRAMSPEELQRALAARRAEGEDTHP